MDEIIKYVMETPENTNPNVLKGMLEDYAQENNSSSSFAKEVDVQFNFILPSGIDFCAGIVTNSIGSADLRYFRIDGESIYLQVSNEVIAETDHLLVLSNSFIELNNFAAFDSNREILSNFTMGNVTVSGGVQQIDERFYEYIISDDCTFSIEIIEVDNSGPGPK